MPEAPKQQTRQPYFGSVRFFKHMIIGFFVLIVTVPTIIAVTFGLRNSVLKGKLEELYAQPPASSTQEPSQTTDPADTDLPDLAVELPTWQGMYPKMYAEPAERSTIDQEKTVYLTFDDGPSAQTSKILEVLEEYNVKATFFVVGFNDEKSMERMKQIVDAGHTIGVHTYTHDYKKIYASPEAFLDDFYMEYNLIHEATGVYPQIFRFPGGSINGYNGVTYRDIISEMVRRGFVYFDWNVATGDAVAGTAQSAEALAANALERVDVLRRAIILMHDSADKATTVEALPAIIEGYQNAGFSFAALSPEVVPVVYNYPE